MDINGNLNNTNITKKEKVEFMINEMLTRAHIEVISVYGCDDIL